MLQNVYEFDILDINTKVYMRYCSVVQTCIIKFTSTLYCIVQNSGRVKLWVN